MIAVEIGDVMLVIVQDVDALSLRAHVVQLPGRGPV